MFVPQSVQNWSQKEKDKFFAMQIAVCEEGEEGEEILYLESCIREPLFLLYFIPILGIFIKSLMRREYVILITHKRFIAVRTKGAWPNGLDYKEHIATPFSQVQHIWAEQGILVANLLVKLQDGTMITYKHLSNEGALQFAKIFKEQ